MLDESSIASIHIAGQPGHRKAGAHDWIQSPVRRISTRGWACSGQFGRAIKGSLDRRGQAEEFQYVAGAVVGGPHVAGSVNGNVLGDGYARSPKAGGGRE